MHRDGEQTHGKIVDRIKKERMNERRILDPVDYLSQDLGAVHKDRCRNLSSLYPSDWPSSKAVFLLLNSTTLSATASLHDGVTILY